MAYEQTTNQPPTRSVGPSANTDAGEDVKADVDDKLVEENAVKRILGRIKMSKNKRDSDFKRMRENMDFAAGIQWAGQEKMHDSKYVANLTIKNVKAKVANLYARNPQAEYQRRKRLDFQLWDGKLESLLPVVQQAAGNPEGFVGLPMQSKALIADYMHGMQQREMIDKVGHTLEILYQWNFDEHDPDMKTEMKNLVRRTVTCSVGYVRVGFERDMQCVLTSQGTGNSLKETAKRAKGILEKIEEGKIDRDSAEIDTLNQLFHSIAAEQMDPTSQLEVKEHLVFDFFSPTSVIPDTKCKSLKGFIGCDEVYLEYILDLDDCNSYFESDVKIGGDGGAMSYKEDGQPNESRAGDQSAETKHKVCVYEVISKKTKSHCFVCDGHKKFLSKPEPYPVNVYGFWPLRAITFNDVETEPGRKASIYPPSDVELMRHPQKEYNRTREELREHRKANTPMYITMKNYLSKEDKAKVSDAVPNEVVELEAALPQGMTPDQLITPKTKVPIDTPVYDVQPLLQDILYSVGTQEANLGQPNPRGTATGQSIAEQSRMSASTSDIDDLDDLLSWMARVGGEILLQECSEETVKRIVGPGALWPTQPQDREDFLNSIFLSTKAASSGRPNKAIELQNWQMIAPVLQQSGANPQFMVRETLRRLDDQLEAETAFPLMPTQAPPPGQMPGPSGAQVPGQTPPPQQGRPGPGKTGPQPE